MYISLVYEDVDRLSSVVAALHALANNCLINKKLKWRKSAKILVYGALALCALMTPMLVGEMQTQNIMWLYDIVYRAARKFSSFPVPIIIMVQVHHLNCVGSDLHCCWIIETIISPPSPNKANMSATFLEQISCTGYFANNTHPLMSCPNELQFVVT